MDQTLQNDTQPVQENQKVWDTKTIAIVFVIASVMVGIFAVNYFNIIPLYKMIPGFWRLPRFAQKTVSTVRNAPMREATLNAFLHKNIAAPLLFNSTKYFHTNYFTQASWPVHKDSFSVTFNAMLSYDPVKDNVRYMKIFAFPAPAVDQTNLRTALATYFTVALPPVIPCFNDVATKSTYCQQLTRVGQTRQIVGAQFGYNGSTSSAQTDWLYYCELSQNVADNPTISCANAR